MHHCILLVGPIEMNQTVTSQRVLGQHERPCSVEMLEAITLGGYHRNLYNDKFPKHQKSFQIYVLYINELKRKYRM